MPILLLAGTPSNTSNLDSIVNLINLKKILRYLLFLWLISGCGGTGTTQPDNFNIYEITEQTTTTTAVIGFKTSYSAKAVVNYGLSGQPKAYSAEDTAAFTYTHSLTIVNLTPETAYDYQITAWMEEDQTIQSDTRSFTTLPKTENEPLIFDLTVSGVTATSAVISWFTDESSDSRVFYGQTVTFTDSASNLVMTTEHQMTISGLQPVTQYYVQAASQDPGGFRGYSQSTSFTTIQFVFLQLPDTTVSAGSVFYYPVSISQANDLGGLQYTVDYDQSFLTALSLVEGPFAVDNNHDFFIEQIGLEQGTITNYITWFPIFQGNIMLGTQADGSGIVAYIEFQADQAGTAAVSLMADSTIIEDIFDNELEGAFTGGTIIIQ